jgi:hypothetical protein
VPWFRFSGLVYTAGKRAATVALLVTAAFGAPPASSPGELRDIAPPVEMPPDPVWPYYAAAAVCVVAAAAAGMYLVRRRRAAARAAEAAAALRPGPPHEVALEALRILETTNHASREDQEVFYTRLVDILRGYIAGRFWVNAPDATASELLAALCRTGEVGVKHQRLLRALVEEADLVKFAGSVFSTEAPGRALQACRSFVRDTAMEEAHAL